MSKFIDKLISSKSSYPFKLLIVGVIFTLLVFVLVIWSFKNIYDTFQQINAVVLVISWVSVILSFRMYLNERQHIEQKLVITNDKVKKQNQEIIGQQEILDEKNRQLDEKNQQLDEKNQQLEEKNQQLKLASTHKSAFLANMSHELRTPLNAIIGYSEMLNEDAQEQGLKDYISDLSKIRSAGMHLLSLINEILNISKIEAGNMEIHSKNFAINELVDEVCVAIQPLLKKNGNTLILEREENMGILCTDLTKARQALFNILNNACKFTQKGTITFKISTTKDLVIFEISDTGIGMSSKQLDMVFQPFIQGEFSATRKYGGTGLGLAITKKFIEMIEGTISAKSKLSEGSCFIMTLPAQGLHKNSQKVSINNAALINDHHISEM